MVSKNNRYLREVMHSHRVPHYGLRKLGIGVTSVLLGTTLYFGANAPVHADVTPATNGNGTNTGANVTPNSAVNNVESGRSVALGQAQATLANSAAQSNAVASSATNSVTTNTFKPSALATNMINPSQLSASLAQSGQPQSTASVAIDHSALSNAVSDAVKAGWQPTSQPTSTTTVAYSSASAEQSKLEQKEQSQAQNIQNLTKSYTSAVNSANALKPAAANHTALDNAVAAADNNPFITVTRDSDQTVSNPATDYQNQIAQIKKSAQNPDQKYADWKSKNYNTNGLYSKTADQHLFIDRNDTNVKCNIKFALDLEKYQDQSGQSINLPVNNYAGKTYKGIAAEVTYNNFGPNSYVIDNTGRKQHIGSIKRTISNLHFYNGDILINSTFGTDSINLAPQDNPTDGLRINGISQLDVTDTFYNDQGQIIPLNTNTYYALGSQNAEWIDQNGNYIKDGTEGQPATVQWVKGIDGTKAVQLAGSSVTVHKDGRAYSNYTNDLEGDHSLGSMATGIPQNASLWVDFCKKNGISPVNSQQWDNIGSPYQYFGAALIREANNSLSATVGVAVSTNACKFKKGMWGINAWITFGTTIPNNSAVNIHYHYDNVKMPAKPTANYHYNALNVNYDLDTLTVKYVDPNGEDLLTPVTTPNHAQGSQFDNSTQAKVIPGYVLIKSNNVKGTFGDHNETTTFTYERVGNIIPVDKNGKQISGVTPYQNDDHNPSKVKDDEPVPDVPGYTPMVTTVTPKSPNKDTPVVYVQDLQNAEVIYRDLDDNDAQLATSGQISGKAGDVISYNPQNEITALTNEGYVLANNGFPAGVVYDNNNQITQKFYIDFHHGTTTVTPNQPGKPGQPVNPNDPNGPKYPAGTDAKSLTTTSTQTVHYVGADKQTPKDSVTTLTYTRTKTIDKVTGEVINSTDWTPAYQNFQVIGTPQIKGYTPDYQYVGGDQVGPDSIKRYTVTYTKNTVPTENDQHAQVRYLDQDNNNEEIAGTNSGDLVGKPGTQIIYSTAKTIASLENQGYVLVTNGFDYNGQVQYFDNNDATDQTFIVTLKHGTQVVSPLAPGKPGQPINPNDPNGPKYPTGTDAQSLLRHGTQTVHYIGAGSQTPKDSITTVDFGHNLVVDKVTGQIIHDNGWAPITKNYQVIDSPVISGYTPDHAYVGGDTVTVDNPNRVYTVTYTKNSQPTQPSGIGPGPTPTQPTVVTSPTSPTQPTNKPTAPTSPTQPTNKPTAPTSPTQPTNKPTAPTSPTQPTNKPTAPTSPTQPTNKPTAPTSPTQPTNKPTAPTSPTQPTNKPTAPTSPTQPTTKPTAPTSPTQPTNKPTTPTSPTQPTNKPTAPTSPTQPTTKPSGQQPSGQQPSGQQPSGQQPSGQQPSGQQPSGQQPSGQQPSGQQPSGQQPSGQQPSGQQPSGQQPSGQQPSGQQPSGQQPSGQQPSGQQPSGQQPSGQQPSGQQPSGQQPSGQQPTGNQPSGQQPSGQQPSGQQPSGQQPSGQQPSGQQPSGQQPSGQQPSGQQPSGQQPSGQQPSGQQPSGQQPSGQQPSGQQPSGQQPSGQQPSGQQPSGQQPSGQQPSGQQPTGNQPSGQQPSGQQPSGQQPSGQQPSGQQPSGQQPSGQQPSGQQPSGQQPTGNQPSGQQPSGQTPTTDTEKVIVHYVDPNGNPITTDTITGQGGQPINYDPSKTLTDLTNKGYDVTGVTNPTTGQDFDHNPNTDQTYTITVKHGTAPLGPNNQHEAGTPINPNDPNGAKWPSADNYSQNYTYTVHFVGPNDQPLTGDNVQTSTWTRTVTVDKVTGQIIGSSDWTPSQNRYSDVQVPVINGYYTNQATIPGQPTVQQNISKTVNYQPVGQIIPVDPNGNPIGNGQNYQNNPSNPTEVTGNQTVPTIPGYTPSTSTVTPINPGANTQVTYTKNGNGNSGTTTPTNESTTTITYVDQNSGQPVKTVTLNGQPGSNLGYNPATDEQTLENQGYEIVKNNIPDNATFGSTPEHYTITVKHGTTTLGPNNQHAAGTPINPNDPNGAKWPAKDTYSKTYTSTVHFVGPNGQQLTNDNVQTSTWTRTVTVDKVTGKVIDSTDWTTTTKNYQDVQVPVVNGYVASQKTVTGQPAVQKNLTTTVTYQKLGQIVPVDQNGNPIGNAQTYRNDPNDPTKVVPNEAVPTISGYTPSTSTVTPTNPSVNTTITYNKNGNGNQNNSTNGNGSTTNNGGATNTNGNGSTANNGSSTNQGGTTNGSTTNNGTTNNGGTTANNGNNTVNGNSGTSTGNTGLTNGTGSATAEGNTNNGGANFSGNGETTGTSAVTGNNAASVAGNADNTITTTTTTSTGSNSDNGNNIALPQTGNTANKAAILGAAGVELAGALGLAGLAAKKKRDAE